MMRLRKQRLATTLLLGGLTAALNSQSPSLVRDFDLGSTLSPGHSDPVGFTNLGGETYFSAATKTRGRELYKIPRGTRQPVLVRDINPGLGSSNPGPFTSFQFRLYFGCDEDLWSSDGTEAGTRREATIGSEIVQIESDSQAVYFRTADGAMFISNGAAANTRAITPTGMMVEKDFVLAAGALYFLPQVIARAQLWTADSSSNRARLGCPHSRSRELWKIDGTDSGTVRIIGSSSSRFLPKPLGVAGGQVVFLYANQGTGTELWRTDGTLAGTAILRDLRPGPLGQTEHAVFEESLVVGDSLYFQARTPESGHELWVTNGTSAGTRIVHEMVPGPESSTPENLTLVNGRLLFVADDPGAGRELFALEMPAHTQPIGFGCASGAQPRIEATPPRVGATMSMRLHYRPAARRRAMILFGEVAARPAAFAGRCAIYVDLIHFTTVRPVLLDAHGAAELQLRIPNNPSLHGVGLCAQAGIDMSSAPLGLALTAGLRLELRR